MIVIVIVIVDVFVLDLFVCIVAQGWGMVDVGGVWLIVGFVLCAVVTLGVGTFMLGVGM